MKYLNNIVVACGIAAGAVSGCSNTQYTGAKTDSGTYSCEKTRYEGNTEVRYTAKDGNKEALIIFPIDKNITNITYIYMTRDEALSTIDACIAAFEAQKTTEAKK